MAFELRQSTARTVPIGPFVDSTDGDTEETGLMISQADCMIDKNGAGAAQKDDADPAAHDANGWYLCPLNTTDTNTLGELILSVHESGALPVWREFAVITQQAWDSKYSTDKLQVDLREIAGAAVNTSSAQLGVNLVNIAASAVNTSSAQLGVNLVNIAASAVNTSSAQLGTNVVTFEGADASDALDACATATGFSTHAAADIWSHASGVTILADVAAIDTLTEASGAGDLAAIKTNVDAIDTLTEAAGDGDLAAIKTAADAILTDTGSAGVVVAAASKTGYALAATGLDIITATAPAGPASNFPEMVVQNWRRWFKKATQTATEIKTYADNGSDLETTQTISDDETTQTQGAAS